ncbi:MAG: DUF6273 domain-containing protein [Holdemanella porci]|uniref:DUF6273 domain-containing protein n=1 Tax=Holdemanella TaxID=1573535 RepID=UPI00307B96D1
MKNMKKFITLCGFLILGSIACGDADVVKAEAINEQATDTSGYTITIPSEISFSTDTTNFDISAGLDKSTQIIITASSQNGFNLTNRDDTVPYSISDNLITLSNSRPDISNTVSQSLNIFIDKSKNPMYGGDYKDTLTFNIQEKQLYTLNVNGLLDGNTLSWLNGYGTFGIKINGRTINNLTDFYQSQAEGTTYEIYNIKATDGKHYIGDTIIKGTFDSPYQEINLKFDTNKLTLNYHADGAQSWNDFQDIVQDVSNKDVVYSEAKKYGDTFDSQDGLVNVNRLTKKGYTTVANTWTIKEAGNKKVMDNVGLAKSQDVAEYCGVLNEFKKNDTVIDLYPIWSPIQSQLNLNANGGSFSDNSTFKIASDKLVYDSSSNDNINTYTPTRKGYDFDGWYTDETGGTKVYNADGSAVNGTQYWQNNVYQNTEGTNILRGDAGQNMAENLFYGEVGNSFKGRIIDNGWVNDSFLNYGKCKKITISPAPIENNSYRGTFVPVLDNYCNRVSQSKEILRNKKAMISFKIKSDTPMAFEYWGLESTSTGSPYVLKTDSEWKTVTLYAPITDVTLSNNTPRSLVFYTTSSTGTYYIGDVAITLDTDIELFAHWTKKNYSAGTVLNIEGSEYVVLEQKENNQALVMTADSIGHKKFQSNSRTDGQNQSTYEGSEIDNYLENEWYNSLSYTMKSVIQATNIKQASYSNDSPDTKQETGPNGQVYNTISRRTFLPSVSEIGKVVNLKNPDKMEAFLDGTHIWTRDSCQEEAYYAEYLNAYGGLSSYDVDFSISVRPVFVIDLSKVNYTVTGTVNYK